jgi:hypothetical protein
MRLRADWDLYPQRVADSEGAEVTEAEEARLKALVERIRRNPRVVYVNRGAMRTELERVRPEDRTALLDNLERWAARQEELLFEEYAPGSVQ